MNHEALGVGLIGQQAEQVQVVDERVPRLKPLMSKGEDGPPPIREVLLVQLIVLAAFDGRSGRWTRLPERSSGNR